MAEPTLGPVDRYRRSGKRHVWIAAVSLVGVVLTLIFGGDPTPLIMCVFGSLILAEIAEVRADLWLSIFIHRPDLMPREDR